MQPKHLFMFYENKLSGKLEVDVKKIISEADFILSFHKK